MKNNVRNQIVAAAVLCLLLITGAVLAYRALIPKPEETGPTLEFALPSDEPHTSSGSPAPSTSFPPAFVAHIPEASMEETPAAAESRESALTISDYNIPPDQDAGDIFGILGVVASEHKISSVTVAVYDHNGVAETFKTAYPDAYTYNLDGLDYDIFFDLLTSGAKTYEVIASDELGSKVLISSSFTVR